jgi:hypothetical protein
MDTALQAKNAALAELHADFARAQQALKDQAAAHAQRERELRLMMVEHERQALTEAHVALSKRGDGKALKPPAELLGQIAELKCVLLLVASILVLAPLLRAVSHRFPCVMWQVGRAV